MSFSLTPFSICLFPYVFFPYAFFPTSFFLDFGLSIGNPLSFKFQFWNRFVKCCLALYSIEHLLACPLVRLTTLNLLVRILCVCVGSCLSSGLHINPTQSKLCTQPRSHAGTHRLLLTVHLLSCNILVLYFTPQK